MKGKTFSLVTTTINVPLLFESYIKDAIKFKRNLQNVIIAADKKTPDEAYSFCKGLEKKFDIECKLVSPQEQEDYLKRWPSLAKFIPWNCVQRRNIAILMAYESGSDIVAIIDDDNFLNQPDYLGLHGHIGEAQKLQAVSNSSGWWNVCEMLESGKFKMPFFHRGFPLSKRTEATFANRSIVSREGRVVVNAGLWFGAPDVDAITNLNFPIDDAKKSNNFQHKIACDIGTWSPFNSQNTALSRDIIPAYFLLPYLGRYDDIWASFVVRHISDFLGDYVTYGSPLVNQDRNPHNYFKDFDDERFGLEHTDVFLKALSFCKMTSNNYKSVFSEISEQFPNEIKKVCKEFKKDHKLFDNVVNGLKIWRDVFKKL